MLGVSKRGGFALIVAALGVAWAGCSSSPGNNNPDDSRAEVARRDGVGVYDSTIDSSVPDGTPDGLFDGTSDTTARDAADGGDGSPRDLPLDAIPYDAANDASADTSVDASSDTSADTSSDTTSGDASVDSTADGQSTDTSVDTTSADGTVDSSADGLSSDATVDTSADGAQSDAPVVSTIGCSDGDREGFTNAATYPNIAGCAGGWSVAGVLTPKSPACNRVSGNSSSNPSGSGCAAEDLCAVGWHICASATEVAAKSSTGCTGAVSNTAGRQLFFTTRQSGPGNAACAATGANDIFGCGNLGAVPASSCTPLDRFSQNLCGSLGAPWSCGSDGYQEANNVTKTAAGGGGVLCCK